MTEDKVKELLVELLGVDESEINNDTNLKEDLGADSLDFTELVMSLEDEYDFESDKADLMKLSTFGDVVKYVESLQK